MVRGMCRRVWMIGALAVTFPAGCRTARKPKWDGDTLVYRASGWELRIQYLSRGSVAEGQHGVLLHDGEPVDPARPGDKINTDLGWLQHYGERSRNRWSGWNFAEREKILHSQRVSAQ
jgi:hypothetical protein